MPAVVVRQRKAWRRRDGVFLYFEVRQSSSRQLVCILRACDQDNAGVIVNPKGEMKGSAITGPVAKECVRVIHHLHFCFQADTYLRLTSGRVSHQTLVPSYKRSYSYFLVLFLLSCSVLHMTMTATLCSGSSHHGVHLPYATCCYTHDNIKGFQGSIRDCLPC